MVLKYKGEVSAPQPLPGSVVQGSELGILLFCVELSDAGMEVPMQLPGLPNTVDVRSLAEPGPRDYHNRHGHILPSDNSILQRRLNDISHYTTIHQLKLNEKKTKVMPFNFTRNFDFLPKLSVDDKQLDVIYSTKLLGVIITSDRKWKENTSYITKKASKRMWFLRRLKALGASIDTLLDYYSKSLRSVLEFGTPIWTGGLTQSNIADIEKIQKTCFKIILGQGYSTYPEALELLDQKTLEERRRQACRKFAKKSVVHPKMKAKFTRTKDRTRYAKRFIEPKTKSKRASDGPIPFLTRLLNEDIRD